MWLKAARTSYTFAPPCQGSRQLRDRLVTARDYARFDTIVTTALRNHFDHAGDPDGETPTVYSALLLPASERAGAAPERPLMLARAPLDEVGRVVAAGVVAYEREVHPTSKLL